MMNPWKVLGVNRQSTDDEVRSSYLALMKKLHPDMKKGDTNKAAEVNEAYAVLKDKKRCSIFIKDMLVWNSECPSCRGVGATFKQKGLVGRTPTTCQTCSGAGVILEKGKSNESAIVQRAGQAGRTGRHNQRRA